MTTVAYKDGVMACDSCWADESGMQTTSAIKIDKLSGGGLLGQAGDGDARAVLDILDKVRTVKQFPSRKDLADTRVEFHGLFVLPDRTIYLIDIYPENPDVYDTWAAQVWLAGRRGMAAVGSGSHVAIGAMSAGKSAREAVAIACDWDINSRLPVHSIQLPERPARARRQK